MLPSLNSKAQTQGTHHLYNYYMFGPAQGKKIKAAKKEQRRKNRNSY